ncbi:hypothetical protein [Clostridioides difficile]|uniref:hypothetical protein n=1 Tax=Clostridioides difficile TaxID=1496 RepID=UPI000D1F00C2|nr:hypothetical protein [Clostridioides difficile]
MKYEVITSPFYCLKLSRAFTKGIVEIEDTKRASELVDAGLLAIVETKKKSTRKKVKTNE